MNVKCIFYCDIITIAVVIVAYSIISLATTLYNVVSNTLDSCECQVCLQL